MDDATRQRLLFARNAGDHVAEALLWEIWRAEVAMCEAHERLKRATRKVELRKAELARYRKSGTLPDRQPFKQNAGEHLAVVAAAAAATTPPPDELAAARAQKGRQARSAPLDPRLA